ncbi:MAG: glycosyltransferase [candidate division KSB1 bacterium]|nr:glycosyltransferase [candidate division KSB1 bacterium]
MNNIRVGFYLKNKRISQIDCRNIDRGNPGIGGTFYAMISLIYYLNLFKTSSFVFKTYLEAKMMLPSDINATLVDSTNELGKFILHDNIDILVVSRINELDANEELFSSISKLKCKVIIWAHTFIPPRWINYYSRNLKIVKVVCVGKEQLGLLLDHELYEKSMYIFNGVNCNDSLYKIDNQRENVVTYIGSLSPHKGFHLLAKSWKKVLKVVPDATLNVIGTGQLYDRKTKLGKYGLAEKYYEKLFVKYILDSSGNILPSVRFLGILGVEKKDVLNKTKVGVPNPSGLTETFGYTAIELQLAGCSIVTKKCPGYLDTVYKESGILLDKTSPYQLANAIISLLQREGYNSNKTVQFIKDNFSFQVITKKWFDLFLAVYNDNIVDNTPPLLFTTRE